MADQTPHAIFAFECTVQGTDWHRDEQVKVAQRDETIRQAKDWTQHNFDEAVKQCQRAEAAEARCATLTEALEAQDVRCSERGRPDCKCRGCVARAALAAAPQGGKP